MVNIMLILISDSSGVSRTVINEALNRLNKRSDQRKISTATDDSTAKTKGFSIDLFIPSVSADESSIRI